MFYLITGDNTALIEDEKDGIEQSFSGIPFETLKSKSTFDDFIFNTESCDMFSPQKGQFIIEPSWFKKTTKNQQIAFEQCLTTAKNHQLPIAFILKKADKRSVNYKLLKKFSFTEINCQEFKEWETQKIIDWICNYCKKINATIHPETAQILIDAYGSQLGIIKQEIQKCLTSILPEKTLTKSIILQTSNSAIGEYTLLSNAIKVGNKNKIVHHIYQLLKQKEDPHKIMNQILFQMNQLLPIGYAIDQQLYLSNFNKNSNIFFH